MRYVELAAGPSLADCVECFWALEDDGDPAWERVLPDGRPEVVIHFGDPFVRRVEGRVDRQTRALLAGNVTQALHLRPTGTVGIVGARLFPHAIPRLFGAPGREFIDQVVPLADVVGRDGHELEGRVDDATSVGERVARLGRFLARGRERWGAGGGDIGPVVRRLLASSGAGSVDDVLSGAGTGRRQMERLFRRDVGWGPKRLLRVVRFQRVVGELTAGRLVDVAAVAARCGYADQAHLTREFRELAGLPPRAYLRERHAMADHFAAANP